MAKFLINGFILHLPDHLINDTIRKSINNGRYEGQEAVAVDRHITAEDRVLELGAGAGYITMQIASRTGGENLLSVEANPKMVPVVEKNLDTNLINGVRVINAAVVPDDYASDHVSFHMTAAFWASSLNGTLAKNWASTKTIDVPAIPFGELMRAHQPTVVIMDIEGGEQELFGAPWPNHVRLLVIELHPKLYPDQIIQQIFNQMSASGLTYCPLGSNGAVVVFKRLTDTV